MLFNSIQFICFYIVVVTMYFALPHRMRWVLLLIGSYYFYMCWRPMYALLLLGMTIVTFASVLLIARSSSRPVRLIGLWASLAANVGTLFAFKYLGFALDSARPLVGFIDPAFELPYWNVILPVGISFHSFQSIAYTLDVYRGTTQAERHPGIFSLFIVFFPQLLAGPIERSAHMLPQFREVHTLSYDRFRGGMQLILLGFFKKMVIADLLGRLVATVYGSPEVYPGWALALATLFFAVQIYCDFSGYSDIAVGTARIMGFDLMINFRQPYLAASFAEFWRRWHISLSTWFRDYVYLPLGGSRRGLPRWVLAILVVFLVSGAWHGANWTFIVWGALHAVYMLGEGLGRRWLGRKDDGSPRLVLSTVLRTVAVFCFVMIAWVFFRASSVSEAVMILNRMAHIGSFSTAQLFQLGLPRFDMMLALSLIVVLLLVDLSLDGRLAVVTRLWQRRTFRWTCYTLALWSIICLGNWGQTTFIYFQF